MKSAAKTYISLVKPRAKETHKAALIPCYSGRTACMLSKHASKFILFKQRRRNRGGNGGARPRIAETAETKVSFRHRNGKFTSCLHIVLHIRTAGELTRRTQHAPKLLVAGDYRPGPHRGAYSGSPRLPAWWTGGLPPLPRTLPHLRPSGFQLALPRNVAFVPTPLF